MVFREQTGLSKEVQRWEQEGVRKDTHAKSRGWQAFSTAVPHPSDNQLGQRSSNWNAPKAHRGQLCDKQPYCWAGSRNNWEPRPPKGVHASTPPWGGNDSMWVKSWFCVTPFPLICLWDWDTPDSVLGKWSAIPPDAGPGQQTPRLLHLSDGSLHRVLGSFHCSELNSKSNLTYTWFCLMM